MGDPIVYKLKASEHPQPPIQLASYQQAAAKRNMHVVWDGKDDDPAFIIVLPDGRQLLYWWEGNSFWWHPASGAGPCWPGGFNDALAFAVAAVKT